MDHDGSNWRHIRSDVNLLRKNLTILESVYIVITSNLYMVTQKDSEFVCGECKISFNTKNELKKHRQNHTDAYCASCPIDMAIHGIKKLFKRSR